MSFYFLNLTLVVFHKKFCDLWGLSLTLKQSFYIWIIFCATSPVLRSIPETFLWKCYPLECSVLQTCFALLRTSFSKFDRCTGTPWSRITNIYLKIEERPSGHSLSFFSAAPRQCIELYFDEKYSIEPSWECKFDHIEVRDGPFGFSPIIGRFCGQQNPPVIKSSGRFLWIKFFADGELESMGFSARYNFTPGKWGFGLFSHVFSSLVVCCHSRRTFLRQVIIFSSKCLALFKITSIVLSLFIS